MTYQWGRIIWLVRRCCQRKGLGLLEDHFAAASEDQQMGIGFIRGWESNNSRVNCRWLTLADAGKWISVNGEWNHMQMGTDSFPDANVFIADGMETFCSGQRQERTISKSQRIRLQMGMY